MGVSIEPRAAKRQLLLQVSIRLQLRRSNEQLEALANLEFDSLLAQSESLRRFGELEFRVNTERGSIRSRALIVVAAINLGHFLEHYDGIRGGAIHAYNDAMSVGRKVVEVVRAHEHPTQSQMRSIRLAPLPKKLLKLFEDVEKGVLTPEQGAEQATKLLGPSVASNIELDQFRQEFLQEANKVQANSSPVLLQPKKGPWIALPDNKSVFPAIPKPEPVPPAKPEPPFRVSIVGDSNGRRRLRIGDENIG